MAESVNNNRLLICPSVGVWEIDGEYYFDHKFYEGMKVYKSYWPGKIKLLIRVDTSPVPSFGLVKYSDNLHEFFDVLIINANDPIQVEHLKNIEIVLASADDFQQVNLAKLCKISNVKCIYILEYTFKTRLQIISLCNNSILRKFKSIIWLFRQEFRLRNALIISDGLQANGMAAYKQYSRLVANSIMYFDTRNTNEMLISKTLLNLRLEYLDTTAPLRLCFSGRLTAIKGVEDLIELASELKKRKISYYLNIFGSGDLDNQLKSKINAYSLQDTVFLQGAVAYETELVPYIKNNVDLFICCHKQGDPSCTYLETYACGVPIVGYANEAHIGIVDIVDVGWVTPLGSITKLADQIEHLNNNRHLIKPKAMAALKFSENHTFEKTFERRIQHCVDVMNVEIQN